MRRSKLTLTRPFRRETLPSFYLIHIVLSFMFITGKLLRIPWLTIYLMWCVHYGGIICNCHLCFPSFHEEKRANDEQGYSCFTANSTTSNCSTVRGFLRANKAG